MAVIYFMENTTPIGITAATSPEVDRRLLEITAGGNYETDTNDTALGTCVDIPNATSYTCYAYSAPEQPGLRGRTGNYTIESGNITVANSAVDLDIRISRTNSAGTIQTSSAFSAAQTLSATGYYTYTFSSQSLGTWASGDRFLCEFRFTNTNAHGSNQSVEFDYGNPSGSTHNGMYIVTPFIARTITGT